MMLPTMRVVAEVTRENPLGYVVINESDYHEGQHEAWVDPASRPSREQLDVTIAALPGDYTDPDYVVNGMRNHFGDMFTADDEAKVRGDFKPPASPKGGKPKGE